MRRIRRRVTWLLFGADRTTAALDSYGDALRALQEKVARIDADVQALRARTDQDHAELARLDGDLAELGTQLRAAVDDLGDRIGAVVERLD